MLLALADTLGFFGRLLGGGGLSPEPVALSVSFAAVFGKGNKNMVTLGSVRNFLSFSSIGNLQVLSGCSDCRNS